MTQAEIDRYRAILCMIDHAHYDLACGADEERVHANVFNDLTKLLGEDIARLDSADRSRWLLISKFPEDPMHRPILPPKE